MDVEGPNADVFDNTFSSLTLKLLLTLSPASDRVAIPD